MKVIVTLNGAEHVVERLNRARASKGMVTSDMLKGIGELGVRSVQRGIRNQTSPDGTSYAPVNRFGQGGQRLQDTNRLLRSISYEVGNGRVSIGTNVIYAAMQHFGGVQKPKTAKMLAIPLTRQVARAVANGLGYRQAFPDAFIFRSAKGNLFLARRTSAAGTRRRLGLRKGDHSDVVALGQLELLAILKDSVRIQGTHFLGLSKEGETDILNYIERSIGKLLEAGQ